MPKTVEEIEQLKRSWVSDPCWDIESTEGFEDHFEELQAFHLTKAAEWKARAQEEKNAARQELSKAIGGSDNVALLDYFLNLERRIAFLEEANEERERNENQERMVDLYKIVPRF